MKSRPQRISDLAQRIEVARTEWLRLRTQKPASANLAWKSLEDLRSYHAALVRIERKYPTRDEARALDADCTEYQAWCGR